MKNTNTIRILLLLFLITSVLHLKAQNTVLNCGSDKLHSQLLNKNPEYKAKYQEYEKEILRYQKRDLSERENPSFVLPVVVHIIHNGGAENISNAEVQTGIDNLNEAYANTGYYDPSTGVNTGIQFCLAQRTPNGDATTGITRTKSSLTKLNGNTQDIALKNLVRWDPEHYINIWLVKSICMDANCSVIGYAYLPPAHGTKRDGMVVEAGYFARTKSSSAVQIHEMGHYLGLFHTFQGGCKNDNCLTDGDKVCDTPPDNSTFRVKCGEDFNSCSTDVNSGFTTDQNDMYWNYMDYGDLNCYSAFTEGQRKRMIFTIQEIRKSLLDSKACIPPCSPVLNANFISLKDTVSVGETISFNNQSSANASIFSWEINSKTVSSDKDLTYQFKETGTFTVTLKAYNSDKSCYDFINRTIVVICGAEAGIDVDKTNVLSGETVSFKSKATGSYTFNWYNESTLIGTGQQIDYIFYEEGVYTIELIVSSGQWACSDTAKVDIIVTCPVESDFSTSSFFPHEDSLVIFTNNSTNATSYIWEINGVKLSTGKNFSYVFTDAGEYTVCLIAKNGDCKKKYCKQIFVLDENTDDCEDVYLKRIGDLDADEHGSQIINLGNDIFAIGGSINSNSSLIFINNRGKILKTKSFKFLTEKNSIYYLYKDLDGYLLGTGISGGLQRTFVFKYDYINDVVIWNKVIGSNNTYQMRTGRITQIKNNNYILSGQVQGSVGEDAYISELKGNSGATIWHKRYNTGSVEDFTNLLIKDNFIYGIGRFALYSSSKSDFRGVVMKMDMQGNNIWTKYYLIPVSKNARNYIYDIVDDNGILLAFSGDEFGSSSHYKTFQFVKIDYSGNVIWDKRYEIKNSTNTKTKKVINLPNGYMVAGEYVDYSNKRRITLVEINKTGDVIWSKSYEIGETNHLGEIIWYNGYYYITGTISDNGKDDIIFLKVDINGNIIDKCNDLVKSIDISVKNLNRFSSDVTIEKYNDDTPLSFNTPSVETIIIKEENICKKDCVDTCLIAPDASLVILDSQCKQDSFILNFEICNLGEHTIPINTPVSIYTRNPLTQNSNLIALFYIPDSIPKNNCKQYSYVIKSPGDITIYAFVNDNGNSMTPFTPDIDLPNTGILECNWDNNLGSLSLRESKTKKLDLGNDTTMCISGIVNLNAGSGFESYKWNDGSTDSIFTAWNPGKYWVEVVDYCGNIQFDSIEIRVDPATIIDLGDDISICFGESVEFDLDGFQNYQWTPKEIFDCDNCSKVSIKPKEDVEIIVNANDKKGCYTSDTISIFVYDEKHIRLPNDTTINLGDKIRIIPEFVDNELYSYNWSPDEGLSCFDCYSPEAFPLKTTKYTLELTDENGCTFSDEIEIRIKKNIIIDIPNVFTPNGDGKNDIFYIKGKSKGIKEVNTFKVFDRWGELIYDNSHFFINDPVNGWDGKFKGQRVNPGVYVYLVIVELIDNSQVKYSGDITVIR